MVHRGRDNIRHRGAGLGVLVVDHHLAYSPHRDKSGSSIQLNKGMGSPIIKIYIHKWVKAEGKVGTKRNMDSSRNLARIIKAIIVA